MRQELVAEFGSGIDGRTLALLGSIAPSLRWKPSCHSRPPPSTARSLSTTVRKFG
jgi:hypothetical protein